MPSIMSRLRVPTLVGGLGFAAAVSPSLAARQFFIEEYRVEGNTVLPATDIETAVYGFLGPGRSPEDIEKARAALEDLYQKRGYPTVTVELPRQVIEDGIVRLTVTERRVGRLRVTNAKYHEPEAVKRGAPSLAPGVVPNVNAVQRDVIALNRLADRTVTPELKPGREPDTMDVDLNVSDRLPFHGSLELNNRYSADTSPLRVVGSVSYDNLWQRGDSVSGYFQVAPQNPSNATVVATTYTMRIPSTGLSLTGSYLYSNSNVASVGGTNVIGKGQIAGVRLIVPLPGSSGYSHSFAAGGDYKSFSQMLTLQNEGTSVPLTYYPISVSYNGDWTRETSRTNLNASFVMGTPSLGSSTAQYQANRAYATPSWSFVRGTITRTDDLPYGMQLWVRLQGQGSGNPLVPNEQFAVGGLDTVRGYLEAEVLGDSGAAVQVELRSPSFAESLAPAWVQDLRVHIFYDAGGTSLNDPLAEQRRYYGLNSVGVGVRARFGNHASFALENAFTLSNAINTKRGADALLFRVLGDF